MIRIRKTSLAVAASAALASAVAVGPAPATAGHGTSVAALGVVLIQHNIGQNPTFTPTGALGNATLWTCSDNVGAGTLVGPYVVTCTPTANALKIGWHCNYLHADILGQTATARGRTSLDCDGDNVPEAQTVFIGGTTYDYDLGASTVAVKSITCTVDNNTFAGTPIAQYRATCGDPGLVQIH